MGSPVHLSTFNRLPAAASVSIMLIACLTLVGWVGNIITLKSVLPGLRPMVPLTILGLVLSGSALWLLSRPTLHRARLIIGLACAALTVLLGLVGLIDNIFDLDIAGDYGLRPREFEGDSRPAPSTGLSFVLSGCALLMLPETRGDGRPAQLLALAVGIIALVTLLGYSYGIVVLYHVNPGMALQTAVAFILLSVGILGRHPERGLMAVATSDSAGGFMLRRLMIAVIGVPSLLGWLNVVAIEEGLFGRDTGIMLLVAVNTIIFLAVIWRNAQLLHNLDANRRDADEALRRSHQELESRVAKRTEELTEANENLRAEIGERQRVAEQLHRSREELADFFENANIGLHWVGPDGVILRANRAELDMLGYERDEYVGHKIAEFHVDPEVVKDYLQRLGRRETLVDYRARLRAKDGTIRHVMIDSSVKWEGERFIHTRCFTRDITERKRAEDEHTELMIREQATREAAEEAQVRYHNLVHGVDAIVWEADAATFRFTFVSKQAEAMLGYPVDRWLEEPDFWVNLIHPDDRQQAVELCHRATVAGRDHDLEYRAVAADGRDVWLHDRVFFLRDSEGAPQQLCGLMVDVTERKRAEEETASLLASEKAARAQAEESAELVRRLQVIIDMSLMHLSLSELLSEMLGRVRELLGADGTAVLLLEEDGRGLSPSASVGLPDDVVSELGLAGGLSARVASTRAPLIVDDLETLEGTTANALKSLRSMMGAPLMIERNVMGVIQVSTREARRFTENDLRLLQLVADRVALAIEQARLYDAEQKARTEAEEANRIKDEFLATVSHELRSPLNAILGWVKLLRDSKLGESDAARALETVERSARTQSRIIDDLLDVSRIISGKLLLHVQPIEPARIIVAAVEGLRPAAEAKSISLNISLDGGAGVIMGDSDRVQQLVWNLVANAIKFTPRGGRVGVKLNRVDTDVQITVTDTGAGIKPEFLPHVFDRFRQADGSSTRNQGGLGLGLAIVRHLVELHGGTVRVDSSGEGQGASFTVKLPLAAQRSDSVKKDQIEGHNGDGEIWDGCPQLAGVRVLVVDDDADARDLVAAILNQSDADIRTAGSTREALAILSRSSEWQPDVLVSDIEMPGADGYALIRQVRAADAERGGRLPAVALTAYARVEDRMRALAAGFQTHMAKPVEPADLLTVLAGLTGRLGKKMSKDLFYDSPVGDLHSQEQKC
jgi:PAS domain S-box-containing protein